MEKTVHEREYTAFISYRHLPLDQQAAEIIQRRIERYHVPAEYREPAGGCRLGVVFRDEEELPASSSLSDSITYALDHAKFLIVICTPALPLSKWCETEILYFLKHHDRDHILAVLVDGTPEESFSPYLRDVYNEEGSVKAEVEPLAANIAGKNHSIDRSKLRKEIVRIYAALLGCPFDALWQREKRYRTRKWLTLAGLSAAALAVFLGIVIHKNVQISRQNQELQMQSSSLSAWAGEMLLEQADMSGAYEYAVKALEVDDNVSYDRKAERLLAEVAGAYTWQDVRKEKVWDQSADAVDILYAPVMERLFVSDRFGMVRQIIPGEREPVWETVSGNADKMDGVSVYDTRMWLNKEETELYLFNRSNLKAVSAKDGTEIWNRDRESDSNCQVVSEDGSLIAVIEGTDLIVLQAQNAEELMRFSLEEEEPGGKWQAVRDYDRNTYNKLRFSENGQFLGAVFLQENETGDSFRHHGWIVDLTEKEVCLDITWPEPDRTDPIWGIYVNDQGTALFVSAYDGANKGMETLLLSQPGKVEAASFQNHDPYFKYEAHIPELSKTTGTPELPMLTSQKLAVTVLDDAMYSYDLSEGSYHYHYRFDSDIVGLDWLNREEDVVWIVTETGSLYLCDLEPEGPYAMKALSGTSWKQSSMVTYARMAAGEEMVFLETAYPGRVMMMRNVSDPHAAVLMENGSYSDSALMIYTAQALRIFPSPSGEKVFAVEDGYGKPVRLSIYDISTLELLNSVEFADIPLVPAEDQQVYALDEERVQYGTRILHSDGTTLDTEEMPQEAGDDHPLLPDQVQETGEALAMTFLGDDEYVAVQNYTGQLDIYSVPDGTRVFHEQENLFEHALANSTMESFRLRNGRFLLIGKEAGKTYGTSVIIDPETWTVVSRIPDVYTCFPEANKLIADRKGLVIVYPLYEKEDLMKEDFSHMFRKHPLSDIR